MLSKLSVPTIISAITEAYLPKIVANLNKGKDITIARTKGTGAWHANPDTDEFEYILNRLVIVENEGEKGLKAILPGPDDTFHILKGARHRGIDRSEILSTHKSAPVGAGEASVEKVHTGNENSVEVINTDYAGEMVEIADGGNTVPSVAVVS